MVNPGKMKKWKERALLIGVDYPNNEALVNTFFVVFDYSLKNNWQGAGHAVSSILHVLLKEQEIDCKWELGFVKASSIEFPFCTSWITIGGEVFDIALYRSNPPVFQAKSHIEVSPPIFKGINIVTNKPTAISFGVDTERKDSDRNYQTLAKMTLGEYMNGWPNHKDGLWGEAVEIAKELGIDLTPQDLKTKYSHLPLKN